MILNDSSFSQMVKHPITAGSVTIGNGNDIVIQSMTNTDTNNIEQTVAQAKRMVDAGAQMVRITVPSMKEVDAMKSIKTRLRADGYNIPLIADVHFNPGIAEIMAATVEKVRINPGNFTDKRDWNDTIDSEAAYRASFEKMAERAKPLLQTCKTYGTALRIGVNHGSLCGRIISRHGNGPLAMALSAVEWMDICENQGFSNIVFSMKSSNVVTMISATRLLMEKMAERGRGYPLHIGVTEAGSGLDGRVKSAAGIGALLLQGIGDTIRVSLTEKPENEILFARELIRAVGCIRPEFYTLDPGGALTFHHAEPDKELWIAMVSAVSGYEHARGKLKKLLIQNHFFTPHENSELTSAILQACRLKMSKTEIIACPTCGRTRYNMERMLEQVQERFSQYPGLKIGVMGCIVNGPGEMADADYGIVGASEGNVAVYKGKVKVSGIVPEEEGLKILQELIENNRTE